MSSPANNSFNYYSDMYYRSLKSFEFSSETISKFCDSLYSVANTYFCKLLRNDVVDAQKKPLSIVAFNQDLQLYTSEIDRICSAAEKYLATDSSNKEVKNKINDFKKLKTNLLTLGKYYDPSYNIKYIYGSKIHNEAMNTIGMILVLDDSNLSAAFLEDSLKEAEQLVNSLEWRIVRTWSFTTEKIPQIVSDIRKLCSVAEEKQKNNNEWAKDKRLQEVIQGLKTAADKLDKYK